MRKNRLKRFCIGVALFTVVLLAGTANLAGCLLARDHVYLTWQGDTSTTMTVNYHTPAFDQQSVVYYDTQSRKGRVADYAFQATGQHHQIPGLKDKRQIHSVELTGLAPGATYYFVAGFQRKGVGRECCFRTIPNDGSPIRFIDGGDMTILPRTARLLRQVEAQNPMFAVIGGDLPYANGKLSNVWMWDIWLNLLEHYLVNPENAMIPIVAAIGNHEVNGEHTEPLENAPFFYGFLAQGGSTYFMRTFGPNMALFILDSGHIIPCAGAQADWLAENLARYGAVPFKFASYHVPLYPSHRSFDDGRSAEERTVWGPIFDAHKLTVGFEHHDHTFKRTKPIRNNMVDEQGTVYLGDGCFGVPPREIDNAGAWYLEKASSTAHFWAIEVNGDTVYCRAIDEKGRVFDEVQRPAR